MDVVLELPGLARVQSAILYWRVRKLICNIACDGGKDPLCDRTMPSAFTVRVQPYPYCWFL